MPEHTDITSLINRVKEILTAHHNLTAGKCGLPITKLCLQLEKPYKEVRKVLAELHKEQYFEVRQGLNDKLLFKSKNAKTI